MQGFAIQPGGGIKLISELISEEMGLPVSVLMGANLANEVAVLLGTSRFRPLHQTFTPVPALPHHCFTRWLMRSFVRRP